MPHDVSLRAVDWVPLSIGSHQRMAPSVRYWSLLASREDAKTRREEDADSSRRHDAQFRARFNLLIACIAKKTHPAGLRAFAASRE
ncbi:MAG: hypothetical protein ACKN9U_00625, partial [Pirellulaceae bacterium]